MTAPPPVDRKTSAATLIDAFEGSTIKRRKMIGVAAGIGLGAFGVGTLVAGIGGLIKNPWKPVVPTADGLKAVLWTSDWTPRYKGETIYLGRLPAGRVTHPSPRCARKTSTQAAWRRCSPGVKRTATVRRSSPTRDC